MPDLSASSSRPSRIKARLTTGLGVAATVTLFAIPAVLFAPGCQGHQCESDGFHDYGYGPGEGDFADPSGNVWESTPNDDPNHRWLPFTAYRTWVFHPPFGGLPITSFLVYISADPDPNSPGNNFTLASGNQATMSFSADHTALFVSNSTCAPFYIRVVLTAYPPASVDAGTGGELDGGDDLDGGINADLDAGDGGD